MHVLLHCGPDRTSSEWRDLLKTRVAGLSLIERHRRSVAHAGLTSITCRGAFDDADAELLRAAGFQVATLANEPPRPYVQLDANLVVDPRLLGELRERADSGRTIVCTDETDNPSTDAKSPYIVGVPEGAELKETDPALARAPVITLHNHDREPPLHVSVGRYYWHRLDGPRDAEVATSKVLLATMKSTDGIYARLNRRMSLRISRRLLDTPVTPNLITFADVLTTVIGAALVATGDYLLMLAGTICFWIGGVILDGIDGELARARFESSEFGHWLDALSGNLFYVALIVSIPIGLYRMTSHPGWLLAGAMALSGAIVWTAVFIAFMKKFARIRPVADCNKAFHRTASIDRHPASALYRSCSFLVKRAALPHFVVLFAMLNLLPVAYVIITVACMLAPPATAYASKRTLALLAAGVTTSSIPSPQSVARRRWLMHRA